MNMMNTEVELKLRVDPDSLTALAAKPVLVAASANSEHLHATYFDTADHRLHARALSLRVRREGEQFIQTLKVGDAGPSGLHRRTEWEAPVGSNKPDLSCAVGQSNRVSTSMVSPPATWCRCSRRLLSGRPGISSTDTPDGVTAIDVAIDRGEIRAGDAVLPIAEIELELKLGPAQALFDLALELVGQDAVRVETRSKAERGYALASDRTRCAVKAGRLEIDPKVTGDDALAGIIRHCIGHMIANEACVAAGIDPEGVHQMRVALRRLRSALVLFRPFVPAEQYDWLNAEVKWLAGSLGDARDWDAYTAALLAPVRSSLPDAPELQALAVAVETARRRSYKVAQDAVGSDPLYHPAAQAAGLAGGTGLAQPGCVRRNSGPVPAGGRSCRQTSQQETSCRLQTGPPLFNPCSGGASRGSQVAEETALRRGVLSEPLSSGKRLKQYLQRLEALQEDLGHLNDVATARGLTDRLKKENPKVNGDWRIGCGIVMGWHTQAAGILEPHLVEHWQGFAEAKPYWR